MPDGSNNNLITIDLKGRIDSNNAADVEQELLAQIEPHTPVRLDAEQLEYISSAGLRVLLHLKKANPDLSIVNVHPEVYEVFEMTGFTQMMTVEKAYRVVSVEGCEEIGRGANGTIYRIDQDNVVKVYNNADALEEIQHEREVARLALILGVPTAISYDVVRVGDSYGSVFELLNARSFSKILATEPDKMDWCVKEYVDMLKIIHGTVVPEGELPDMRQTAIGWAEFMREYLPPEAGKKLVTLMCGIPKDDHMLHGDYHTKNLELQGDEVLLIDMDTLCVGHPIFELASMFNAFIGFAELDHEVIKDFQGFDFETAKTFWHKTLVAYLGTEDEDFIKEVEDKARIIGYTRLIRRLIRRNGLESEDGRAHIDFWKNELLPLLDKYDDLLFTPCSLVMEAERENLPQALAFIDKHLEEVGCPMKEQMQIDVAAEEIFVNIASYAYAPGRGKVMIHMDTNEGEAAITFVDSGMQYDPLAKEDPDVTLSAEDRQIGGLGIFMVKNSMDDVRYEYKDNKNKLTLVKRWTTA